MDTLTAPSQNGIATDNRPGTALWRPRMAAALRAKQEMDEATIVPDGTDRSQPPLHTEDNGGGLGAKSKSRSSRGRFATGNKFGRGNPFHRRMAAMRKTFANAITHKEMRELARRLFKRAAEGDHVAATLLMAYAVGRPENVVDPDSVDLDEWRRFQQLPASNAEFERIWYRIPIQTAMELLKALWPERVKEFYKGLTGIAKGEAAPEPDLTPLIPKSGVQADETNVSSEREGER